MHYLRQRISGHSPCPPDKVDFLSQFRAFQRLSRSSCDGRRFRCDRNFRCLEPTVPISRGSNRFWCHQSPLSASASRASPASSRRLLLHFVFVLSRRSPSEQTLSFVLLALPTAHIPLSLFSAALAGISFRQEEFFMLMRANGVVLTVPRCGRRSVGLWRPPRTGRPGLISSRQRTRGDSCELGARIKRGTAVSSFRTRARISLCRFRRN
jgi:hypothetical protein